MGFTIWLTTTGHLLLAPGVHGRKRVEEKGSSRSGIATPIRGAAERYSTSSPTRMYRGEDARSKASEWKLRERRGREEERKAEPEELVTGGRVTTAVPPHAFLHSARGRGVGSGDGSLSLVLRFVIFTFSFLRRALYLLATGLGGGQRGASRMPL
jgi:hypothetical protein